MPSRLTIGFALAALCIAAIATAAPSALPTRAPRVAPARALHQAPTPHLAGRAPQSVPTRAPERTSRSVSVSGGVVVVWTENRGGPDLDLYAQKLDETGAPQWGSSGVAVCTAAGDPYGVRLASDGAGGAIVVWTDTRTLGGDIYAQRINTGGLALWTPNGVAVCANPDAQYYPDIAADGVGGAVIVWEDARNYITSSTDIYAQRVSAAGAPLWTPDGVRVTAAVDVQANPVVASDGAGGCVAGWLDLRAGVATDIYAQRLDNLGAPQWTPDGVAVCTEAHYQDELVMASDGTGGAILTWLDERSYVANGFDVYAQRVNGAGVPQWTPDGNGIAIAAGDQYLPAIVEDGAGGAVIGWYDASQGAALAQRVNAAGAAQWSAGGMSFCSVTGNQWTPVMLADGNGGAFACWEDSRGAGTDIYAQHLAGADGAPQWDTGCVAVCGAIRDQAGPAIVTDSNGGVIVSWTDGRAGDQDFYAQRLNGAGAAQWAANGAPVYVEPGQQRHAAVVADGAGGAILAWQEKRGDNYDIRASRVDGSNASVWSGVIVCGAANMQFDPVAVSDAAGGAIVVWWDERGGLDPRVYAQRVDASGAALWAAGGVELTAGALVPTDLDVVADGAGGVIAAWTDHRAGIDIYAQRLNATGVPVWGASGLAVCADPAYQALPHVVNDGSSGAIVGWTDFRASSGDIYAQRVNAAGAPQWTANGVAVCTDAANQTLEAIGPGAAGEAILVWTDARNSSLDIYAQRVDATGAALWTADGVAVCTDPASQEAPRVLGDGSGGAIFVWDDFRAADFLSDIYAQRLDATGAAQWTANGVAVCAALDQQEQPVVVPSIGGGAIAVWYDHRSGTNADLYAQGIDAAGVPQWAANGVPVCTDASDQAGLAGASDGAEGVIVAWHDRRTPPIDLLYSQRITSAGTIAPGWPGNGAVPVLVSLVSARVEGGVARLDWHLAGSVGTIATIYRAATAGAWQALGSARPDGTGRIAFADPAVESGRRYGYRLGILDGGAERFGGEAWVEVPTAAGFALEGARPNPGSSQGLSVRFTLPDAAAARLELLDLSGRLVVATEVGGLGPGSHVVSLAAPRRLAPGIYLMRLTRAGRALTARAAVLR